jgi:MFS family permease
MLVLYKQKNHYSAVAVNACLAVYVLGLVPSLLVGGTLSDRLGRRPLMLAAVVAGLGGSGCLAL